jgi:hypothetical protein
VCDPVLRVGPGLLLIEGARGLAGFMQGTTNERETELDRVVEESDNSVGTVNLAPRGPLTGKQYWRCGVIRECAYGIGMLAHVRSHQRMLPARDSRAVAMKVGIR